MSGVRANAGSTMLLGENRTRAAKIARAVTLEEWHRLLATHRSPTMRRLASAIVLAVIEEELQPWKKRQRIYAEAREAAETLKVA